MLNLYDRRFFIIKLLYIQQVICVPLENDSRLVIDQRQTGKYNIQISLKDIAIIEVDKNEFVDDTINNADEYYYDDDDLTIKPISSWTISTTVQSTPTKEPVALHHPHMNTTNIPSLNSSGHSSLLSSFTPSSIAMNSGPRPVIEPVLHNQKGMQENIPQLRTAHSSGLYMDSLKEINSTILKIISVQPLILKKVAICKNSYVIDGNGNCRKKRRSSFLKSLFNMLTLMRTKEK